MGYKITSYTKKFWEIIKRDVYVFDINENQCPDIKIGDRIEIDNKQAKVENLEWFYKSFGQKDNYVSILIEEINE